MYKKLIFIKIIINKIGKIFINLINNKNILFFKNLKKFFNQK